MLKIILLLCSLIAWTAARPGYLHGHHHHLDYHAPLHHEPLHHEPLHLVKVVHVPAAISHQSSTIIHSVPHHIVKPIVVHPVIKAYHPAPIIKAYHAAPLHFDPYHHYPHHFH